MKSFGSLFAYVVIIFFCVTSRAQSDDSVGGLDPSYNSQYYAGFHVGKLLPSQIEGVPDIIGLGGVRAGYRLASNTVLEGGLVVGNGLNLQWKWRDAQVDLVTELPIEGMLALALVGADILYYSGQGVGNRLVVGGHAGGALLMHLSNICWFRTDMKFGFTPGTSLYIGAGFEFRWGGVTGGRAD